MTGPGALSDPGPAAHVCNLNRRSEIDRLIGQVYFDRDTRYVREITSAWVARPVSPGETVADTRRDRVLVHLTADNRIERVSYG